LALLTGFALVTELSAEDKPASAPAPPADLAKIDIANSTEGSVPGGTTIVSGAWSVDAGAKKLKALPTPLLDATLEFGPEIREKSAVIEVAARAPDRGKIRSRFGAGLYGKNGFQIRTAPARGEIELVRRGAVLLRKPFPMTPEKLLHLELSVTGERQHWIVSGRAWSDEEARPDKPLFEHKVFASELEFPLAGRSALVATPFSGEAVAFSSASVRLVPPPLPPDSPKK